MAIGTATITAKGNLFIVRWMNVGSFIQNEPRAFRTDAEAREFCRRMGVTVR